MQTPDSAYGSESDSLRISMEEKLGLLDGDGTDLSHHQDLESSDYYSVLSYEKLPAHVWPKLRSWLRGLPIASAVSHLARTSAVLLPSFVQSRLAGEVSKPARLSPTSHLDGMRGLAAFFVLLCHLSYNCFVITQGYGFVDLEGPVTESSANDHILQLPIIRLFYSGPPMVAIFFVISGYSLSLKPIRQARAKQWESLLSMLASSAFRRGVRLFLPTTVSTFLVLVLLQTGWYEGTREFATDETFMRGVFEHHPLQLETWELQFYHWVWKVFEFVHVWGWDIYGGSTSYDLHLWTIPVEFRTSMVLFLTLLALAKTKCSMRLTFLSAIMWFTIRSDHWEVALFIAGAFLAELDLIRGPLTPSASAQQESRIVAEKMQTPHPATRVTSKAIHYWWIAVSVVALYLMSQPDEKSEETPGWMYLVSLIPTWFTQRYRFWQCIGSVLFVLATNNSTTLQKPFNHPTMQYLGKISYALYLVHGPFIHVVGYRIEAAMWAFTGWDTSESYNTGFVLATLCIVPAVIWIADLFWRAVDIPSVRFGRWMERVCAVGD